MSRPRAKAPLTVHQSSTALIRAALSRDTAAVNLAANRHVLSMGPDEVLRLVAIQADLIAWALEALGNESREVLDVQEFLRVMADPEAEVARAAGGAS